MARQRECTTLFVTHDQEEALAIADRVGVMSSGRLDQIATPTDLYARPSTRFVAEFVGLSNRLNALVDRSTATILGCRVPVLDGSLTSGPGLGLVRPESVSVEQESAGNASVASRAFLGPVSRVYCDLDSGESVMAQVSSGVADQLPPGSRVRVSVDPAPVLVVSN